MHGAVVPLPMVGPRECPGDILRMLREVTPFVDVFTPDGVQWWMLRIAPDEHARVQVGRQHLERAKAKGWLPDASHLLMASGRSLLRRYSISLDGNGDALRRDLSAMVAVTDRQLERDFAEALDVNEGIPRQRERIKVVLDRAAAERKSDHGIFFRGRVSSVVPSSWGRVRRALKLSS